MSLIVDPAKTIAALEDLAFFRNFSKLSFNRHIEAVYWDVTNIAHETAKRALLITDKDTELRIANKQLLFFFSLQKFTQQVTEKVSFAKGTAEKDPNMVRLKVQLSPSLLYKKDGSPIGKRYISVPHVDESKLHLFDKKFTFTHGVVTRLYCFADKKQIKVEAISEIEGNTAINECLKVVETKWKLGTAEEHGYTGRQPQDVKLPDLHKITSTANELHVYHPHERPYTFYI